MIVEGGGERHKAPVAVLDIGSNSVRLVVYEHHGRTLTPLFNEKATCALGSGVAKNGRIAAQNAGKALKAIARFGLVTKLMHVSDTHIIATSAVREASNGSDFMAGVELLMDARAEVLSGAREAHYAARGIMFAMPGFAGLVGDLGGGSLEFSPVDRGDENEAETHLLGVLRLQEESSFSPAQALKISKEQLENSDLLGREHKTFCAIGGTWRAFAQLMQARSRYPLHMVDGYQAGALEAKKLALELVEREQQAEGMEMVTRARRSLLPYGAAVLLAVLERGNFRNIVFSSHGVREGYLFDRLEPAEARKDPLIVASKEICRLRARSITHAQELVDFTAMFLDELGVREKKPQRRLRHAACLLSDIGWRGHRDYRGEQSVDLVAYSALIGIDHPGRAFLAEVLAVRYMGLRHKSSSQQLGRLMGRDAQHRARMIGALLRLAYVLSGAMPKILPHIRFEISRDRITLLLPGEFSFLDSLRLQSRLSQLTQHLGMKKSRIRVS